MKGTICPGRSHLLAIKVRGILTWAANAHVEHGGSQRMGVLVDILSGSSEKHVDDALSSYTEGRWMHGVAHHGERSCTDTVAG